MDILSFEDIEQHESSTVEDAWGGKVKLLAMDLPTRLAFDESVKELGLIDEDGHVVTDEWKKLYAALYVAFSIVDADNKRHKNPTEFAKVLSGKDWATITRLCSKLEELSAASPIAIEESVKN